MKKLYGVLILLPISLMFICCQGLTDKVHTVTAQFEEPEPITLLYHTIERNNSVVLGFSSTVKTMHAQIDVNGEKMECSVEPTVAPDHFVHIAETQTKPVARAMSEDASESTEQADPAPPAILFFSITPKEAIPIGQHFSVSGTVLDEKKNSYDFVLEFKGQNHRPAQLKITEVRPLYGAKRSEFIELLVTEEGNLSEITICNIGSKDTPDFQFPTMEVSKNDRIVVHWRNVSQDQKDMLINQSGSPTVHHFWNDAKSIPRRNPNAIAVKSSRNGSLQDALLYFNTRVQAKKEPVFELSAPEVLATAKLILNSSLWGQSLPLEKDSFFLCDITPSMSIGKLDSQKIGKNGWQIYGAKKVSMGMPNTP